MGATEPTAQLVARLSAGDPEAAGALFARYSRQLIRLAERQLSRRVAARAGGEDVVQSAFRTFFRRGARGEFRIDAAGETWRLLVAITVRKARTLARRQTAGVRDVRAEVPGAAISLADALAREPGPAEAALLLEQVELLLRDLPAWYAGLLELRLQGRPVTDIAAELKVSRQTVYRALDLLGRRLAEADAAGGG